MTISRIKYSARQRRDILFDRRHPNSLSKVQQPLTSQECNTLVGFVRPLSPNKRAEDVIRGEYLETDTRQNDVILILLALFIPWNQLPEKFHSYKALLGTYTDYYWNIWEDTIGRLEEYAQYAAKNILQIRKNQLNAKLNRDLRNAARNYQVEDAEIFNCEDNNDEDRDEKGKKEWKTI